MGGGRLSGASELPMMNFLVGNHEFDLNLLQTDVVGVGFGLGTRYMKIYSTDEKNCPVSAG